MQISFVGLYFSVWDTRTRLSMSIKSPVSGIQVGSLLPKGKTDLSVASDANFMCALATQFRAPFLSNLLAVSET